MLKQKSVNIGLAPSALTVFRSPFLWLVLLAGFSTTFVVWRLSNRDIAEQTKERFDSRAEQIVTAVEQRMHAYEQVLRGGAGLFRTGPTITRHQWHEYVENADLAKNYPGIQNFAVDFLIPAAEKDAHIAQIRAEGHPEYSITPEQPERPVYHSLVYVEPFGGRNLRAFGFDMYTNPIRREAMDRAIDLGLPSVSGMVRLAQETNVDVQHGFIYCLPVYHTGRLAVTPEQRRAALRALVCGGFRANDLMRGIFGTRTSDLELEVFDGAITPETQMYNSWHGDKITISTLSRTAPVEVGGRTWILRVSANQAFINSISWTQSQVVMVAGTLLSFALFLGLGLWFDIDRRTQERVRRNSQIFNAVQDSVKESLLVIDKSGTVISSNPTAAQRFALSPDQLIGRNIFEVMPPDIAAKWRALGEEVMRSGRSITFEDALKGRDYFNYLYPVLDPRSQCEAIVIIKTDITERKKAESQIQTLAFSDPLTGLPNRRLLMDRLEQAMAAASRHGRQEALLFIDLDNFKTINDTLGHDKGDSLLKQIAQRLTACVREGDTVARIGGDEFVVLLGVLSSLTQEAATQAQVVATKILAVLGQPYDIEGHGHYSTASIGITLFGGAQRESVEEPMKRAELAMYQAKAAGRDTLCFFEPAMGTVAANRATLEAELREAVNKGQFVLYYQPQGQDKVRLSGVEALVRWQHPDHGLVSPAEFIPIAESSGLILPLGRWVMETACKQLAAWAARPEMSRLTMAVNVSARQFRQPGFVEDVLTILNANGAKPENLKLELTESVLVDNVEDIIVKMNALKARGIGFSIDDFGTGYSSLSYLKRLPLDQLKIDRSFVTDILTDPDDAAIARMVVVLADSLGLNVIAEGVETEAQRDFLASAGCHNYQGYLLSRPLPIEEFEVFAAKVSQGLNS